MKKVLLMVMMLLVLTGCGAQETFETLGNAYEAPVSTEVLEIALDLPAGIAAPVMEGEDTGSVYLADDYTLMLQRMEAGDLNRTFQEFTGFDRERLTVIETQTENARRYESVWTCVGEEGDQVGRIAVLDDGNYHYVMTVMANADQAGRLEEVWQPLFRSFRLVEPGTLINTGS